MFRNKILKVIVLVLLVLLAFSMGFLFAGLAGALFFGTFLTLFFKLLFKTPSGKIKWFVIFPSATALGYTLMFVFGLLGAKPETHLRLQYINSEIKAMGYSPKWFIISQKRSNLYNRLLLNSVDKSKHLIGKAIDIYVIDIDGDWDYDERDFEIIRTASNKINKKIKGRVINYFGKGFFSQRMVHTELE